MAQTRMNLDEIIKSERENERDLFYAVQYDAENLFYLLYTMYVDDNDDHFAWRRDSEVCEWSHEECIDECVKLMDHAFDDDTKSKLTVIEALEIVYPDVKRAAAEVKTKYQ